MHFPRFLKRRKSVERTIENSSAIIAGIRITKPITVREKDNHTTKPYGHFASLYGGLCAVPQIP
jgi:hypothetical protein